MKSKPIFRSVCCALLLAALLATMGCGLITNKKNTVASSIYLVDPFESALVRCDFNADGQQLGMICLEWDTLQPRHYLSLSRDWTCEYGRGGKLRAATLRSAPLTLQKQEDGTLYGKGYGTTGGAHSAQYTVGDNGRIRSATYIEGQKPYGIRTTVYSFGEDGRLSSVNRVADSWDKSDTVYTYEYTADTVVLYCGEELHSTLTLNGSGMPISYLKAGQSEPSYTWKYDEAGRAAPLSENERWKYDEDGRLLSVEAKDENGNQSKTLEYSFDRKGALTRSSKTTVEGSSTTISVLEFSGGLRSRGTSEYLVSDGDGDMASMRLYETEYRSDGKYDKSVAYDVAVDGTRTISQESGYTWDVQGRCTGNYTRRYSNDKLWDETFTEYTYRENSEVCAITKGEIHHEEGYSYDQRTTEYYNEEFQKTGGSEELTWLEPDENGDMVRSESEYDYNDSGNITHAITYGYKNDELVSEIVREYDFVIANGYYMTYHAKEYEDGVMTREYKRVEDEKGGSVCSEQRYVDGVLREEIDEIKEYGEYKIEDGTMFTRPVDGTYKTYDEQGTLVHVERRLYTFYEDGTRKSTEFIVSNPGGQVIDTYIEQYDEQGKLTSTTKS